MSERRTSPVLDLRIVEAMQLFGLDEKLKEV